jgi:hypothetical protein
VPLDTVTPPEVEDDEIVSLIDRQDGAPDTDLSMRHGSPLFFVFEL